MATDVEDQHARGGTEGGEWHTLFDVRSQRQAVGAVLLDIHHSGGSAWSEFYEGVVTVGITQQVAVLCDEVEDVFAHGYGGFGVLVIASAEVGVFQLEVLRMDNVARHQTIAHKIERMARRVARGGNGLHQPAKELCAVGKSHHTSAVGFLHPGPEVGHAGQGTTFDTGGALRGRDVEGGIGEGGLAILEKSANMVAMQMGETHGIDIGRSAANEFELLQQGAASLGAKPGIEEDGVRRREDHKGIDGTGGAASGEQLTQQRVIERADEEVARHLVGHVLEGGHLEGVVHGVDGHPGLQLLGLGGGGVGRGGVGSVVATGCEEYCQHGGCCFENFGFHGINDVYVCVGLFVSCLLLLVCLPGA